MKTRKISGYDLKVGDTVLQYGQNKMTVKSTNGCLVFTDEKGETQIGNLGYPRYEIIEDDCVEQFIKHGLLASFHYADDTTREWGLAREEKLKALEIFDANPDRQKDMREAAKGFLWAYEFKLDRPEV